MTEDALKRRVFELIVRDRKLNTTGNVAMDLVERIFAIPEIAAAFSEEELVYENGYSAGYAAAKAEG